MDDSDLWQEAQDRVLLYLKKLGVPAILSLEVAQEALRKTADEALATGGARLLRLVMGNLHLILHQNPMVLEKTPYAEHPILYRRWHQGTMMSASCSVTDPGTAQQSVALPPINRASMTIKRI